MSCFDPSKHNELITKKNIIENGVTRGLEISIKQFKVTQGNKIERSVVSKGSLQMIKAKHEVKH